MGTLEDYLKEVAHTNKLILSPQDPICVLHTMLAKFEGDIQQTLATLSQGFAAQLELEYKKSSDLTSEQMQKLLEAALSAARADAKATYTHASEGLVSTFATAMDERLSKAEKAHTSVYYVAMANAFCSVCLVVTALFMLLR